MIDWNVHDENITILGMQGSGKTTLARRLLDSVPSVPRLIISPQNPRKHYGQYGHPVGRMEDIRQDGFYLWTAPLNQRIFDRITRRAMQLKNMLLVIDDAHEFATKQKMPPDWATLINSGRNRGITSIFISPAPNVLNNIIMQSSHHLVSFRFALESQIEHSRKNFFGDSGYLLMNPAARPRRYRKWPALGPHDYLYRNIADPAVYYHDAAARRTYDLSEGAPPGGAGPEPEPEPEEPRPAADLDRPAADLDRPQEPEEPEEPEEERPA